MVEKQMVGEVVVPQDNENNCLGESAGQTVPLNGKGNFQSRPHPKTAKRFANHIARQPLSEEAAYQAGRVFLAMNMRSATDDVVKAAVEKELAKFNELRGA